MHDKRNIPGSARSDQAPDPAGAGKTAPADTPPPAQENPAPPTAPPDTSFRVSEFPKSSSLGVSESSKFSSFRGAPVSHARAGDITPIGEILEEIPLPNPQDPTLNEGSPLADLVYRGRRTAHEFADQIRNGSMPGYQVFFHFAREFKADAELSELGPAVEAFCDELSNRGIHSERFDFSDREDCWLAFEKAWRDVRIRKGEGPLDIAHRLALAAPIEIAWPAGAGDLFKLITSIAYYLAEIVGETFRLNQKAVAKVVGTTQPRVSTVVLSLLEHKIIIRLPEPYIPGKKDYRYRLGLVLTNLREQRRAGKLTKLFESEVAERRKTKPQDGEK